MFHKLQISCRSGAFECHPQLTRYRNRGGVPSTSQLSHDLDDSEPPNVSYTADQLVHSDHDNDYDDEMESIDDEDSDDDDEWADPTDYAASTSKESEMDTLVDIDKFETEWEHLEPSEQETRLFEEEHMKQQLHLGSSHDHTHQVSSFSSSASSPHQAVTEREIQRDRLRRLDYESTYMDFAASVASSGNFQEQRVQLNATDSVRLLGSINEAVGEGGGATTPTDRDVGSTQGTMKEAATPAAEESQGFFGTLSSLWTSTFGGRSS